MFVSNESWKDKRKKCGFIIVIESLKIPLMRWFEKIIKENNSKGNFEILLKIQGLLNEIK